ncbi:hypothetical protein DSO57_1014662 [Entomophthora muscae]|uniref:Uncharacterized protein n=1 Tax=Entomophthora muscae TaxID=34485 RepID=A0ACC2RWM7_9FUNG|nr:hypothetical protein DSO57_1014662 [Entomophthora muscae]
MKFLSLTFFLSMNAYLLMTREKCLSRWVERSRDKNPDYACAFFKRNHAVMQGEWIEIDVLWCGIHPYQGYCARRGCKDCIIARVGDGGSDNWGFETDHFYREDNRLYVL